jgi:hypothetical protein
LHELGPDADALDAALDSIEERIRRVMREPLTRDELAELVQGAW